MPTSGWLSPQRDKQDTCVGKRLSAITSEKQQGQETNSAGKPAEPNQKETRVPELHKKAPKISKEIRAICARTRIIGTPKGEITKRPNTRITNENVYRGRGSAESDRLIGNAGHADKPGGIIEHSDTNLSLPNHAAASKLCSKQRINLNTNTANKHHQQHPNTKEHRTSQQTASSVAKPPRPVSLPRRKPLCGSHRLPRVSSKPCRQAGTSRGLARCRRDPHTLPAPRFGTVGFGGDEPPSETTPKEGTQDK